MCIAENRSHRSPPLLMDDPLLLLSIHGAPAGPADRAARHNMPYVGIKCVIRGMNVSAYSEVVNLSGLCLIGSTHTHTRSRKLLSNVRRGEDARIYNIRLEIIAKFTRYNVIVLINNTIF